MAETTKDLVRLPSLGPKVERATVVRWLVAKGHVVAVGQPLVELSTRKATLELAADRAGRVTSLVAPVGLQVAVGEPLLELDLAAGTGVPPWIERSPPGTWDRNTPRWLRWLPSLVGVGMVVLSATGWAAWMWRHGAP